MLKRSVLANHSNLDNALAVPNQSESRETVIRISEDLYQKVEQFAALQGVPIGSLIEEVLNRYFALEVSGSKILQVHQEALRRLGEE